MADAEVLLLPQKLSSDLFKWQSIHCIRKYSWSCANDTTFIGSEIFIENAGTRSSIYVIPDKEMEDQLVQKLVKATFEALTNPANQIVQCDSANTIDEKQKLTEEFLPKLQEALYPSMQFFWEGSEVIAYPLNGAPIRSKPTRLNGVYLRFSVTANAEVGTSIRLKCGATEFFMLI